MPDQAVTKTQIIGVAGTNGSGKDALMEFLSAKYEFLFMSATDMLRTELERRHLPTDRLHKSQLSAEWRREFGFGVIVQKAYETWEQQASTYKGLVVGSLRHPGEVDLIHEYGGQVIWLDADARVRYERIQVNAAGRGQRAEDAVSFEQFLADEAREMHPVGDEATLNVAAVKDRCDIFLNNDGANLTVFQEQIEAALGDTFRSEA